MFPVSIIVRRLLTMGVLLAAFGSSATVVMYFALRGRTVQVPNVIGRSQADAESVLADNGLRMDIRGRSRNDKIPENAVSDQSPAPGTTVKTGQLVRVSVSLGSATEKASAPSGR